MKESAELQSRKNNKYRTRCICQPQAVGAMLAQSPLSRELLEGRENVAATHHCASTGRRHQRRGHDAALNFRDAPL